MRMTLFLGIFAFLLPMTFYANPVEEPEKIYLEPSQVAFADRGIFIFIAGEWIPVDSIHSDARGLYVASKYPRSRWICSCGYNNYGGDDTCQRVDEINGKKCGRPRPPG